jgi:hypothetical protein
MIISGSIKGHPTQKKQAPEKLEHKLFKVQEHDRSGNGGRSIVAWCVAKPF